MQRSQLSMEKYIPTYNVYKVIYKCTEENVFLSRHSKTISKLEEGSVHRINIILSSS